MNIIQLRDYLNALMAAGVSPNLPACIHEEDPVLGAIEISDAIVLKGRYREDPSPKMCAFRPATGEFLMLQSCLDYAPMLDDAAMGFVEIDTGVEPPYK